MSKFYERLGNAILEEMFQLNLIQEIPKSKTI
ncbi:hypothetical protein IG7_02702 [Bacillus cereus HuA2-4]|nr:hypothetical protein IG7_02702 [Bacillus cereus HuA2-4]